MLCARKQTLYAHLEMLFAYLGEGITALGKLKLNINIVNAEKCNYEHIRKEMNERRRESVIDNNKYTIYTIYMYHKI